MYDSTDKTTDKTTDNQAIPAPVYTGPVGWKCPVCGRGNAPFVSQCPCTCNGYPQYIPVVPPGPWYPQPWGAPIITCCAGRGTMQG